MNNTDLRGTCLLLCCVSSRRGQRRFACDGNTDTASCQSEEVKHITKQIPNVSQSVRSTHSCILYYHKTKNTIRSLSETGENIFQETHPYCLSGLTERFTLQIDFDVARFFACPDVRAGCKHVQNNCTAPYYTKLRCSSIFSHSFVFSTIDWV